MNYYAVKALEARVLQYIGDYKNAAIAAKVVTDQIGEKEKCSHGQMLQPYLPIWITLSSMK